MKAIPLSLKQAQDFVNKNHRHHRASVGHKFSVGAVDDEGNLIGVAMCGRPVSRYLDDGSTIELTRLCTDGTRNACSFLYSRCARIAKEFGYKKIITYILETEPGTSLRASGWRMEENHVGGVHGIIAKEQSNVPFRKVCLKKSKSIQLGYSSNDGARNYEDRSDRCGRTSLSKSGVNADFSIPQIQRG